MPIRLKQEEIQIRINAIQERKIELVGVFQGVAVKHKFRCIVDGCGYEWMTNFDKVQRGSGCPLCFNKTIPARFALTENEVALRIVFLRDRGIKLVSPFTKTQAKHIFKCLVSTCEYTWTGTFNDAYRGKGCGRCAKNVVTNQDIEERLLTLRQRNIELVGNFTKTSKKHFFKCLVPNCNWVWATSFTRVFNGGTGCAKCKGMILSKEEKVLSNLKDKVRRSLTKLAMRRVIPKNPSRKDLTLLDLYDFLRHQIHLIPAKPLTDGQWQLDHIIPVSCFDPTKIEEMRLCWDYRNLRWITLSENSSKGNRIREKDIPFITEWHRGILAKCSFPKSIPDQKYRQRELILT